MQLTSGVGLRQAGRNLGLDIHSVVDKRRKLARTCRLLHAALGRGVTGDRTFLLDEEETFAAASIRPLTMPVVIEKETWFIVATAVGSIRRLAKPGSRRRRRQNEEEKRLGRRLDRSRRCVRAVMGRLSRVAPSGRITLRTDEKASYASIARAVLGERVEHQTTPGTLVRAAHNPLFAINTTMAMSRENCACLRRRSWSVSKRPKGLRDQLALFTSYRNYVRRRFNRDGPQETPAKLLQLAPRALTPAELLAWRQDWGDRSIHPISLDGQRTVGRP